MTADFGSLSLKMAGSLLLILGLIISLFYVLKRLRFSSLSPKRYPEMRLLGSLNLAPKRAIALIEVCDQWLIVGIGMENVTLISKLDRPPEASNLDAGTPSNEKSFHSFLQNRRLWRRDRKINTARENA